MLSGSAKGYLFSSVSFFLLIVSLKKKTVITYLHILNLGVVGI